SKAAGLVTCFDMRIDRAHQARLASAAPPLDSSDTRAVLRAQTELARDQITDGRYEPAERLLKKALERGREQLAADDLDLLDAASLLGECLARQGKFTDAEKRLLESHQQLAALGDAASLQLRGSCERLVQLYETSGDSQRAAQWRTEWAE